MNKKKIDHMVFFHHAGGNAAAMNDIAQHFSPNYNTIVLEMAGRGRRRREVLMRDVKQVIDDFVSRIPQHGRLILIGHSLGAYLAYLLARHYNINKPSRDIILVVMSNEPIHCRRNFEWLEQSKKSQKLLWKFALRLRELPDWLTPKSSLGQDFIKTLAADLIVVNSIKTETSYQLSNIPLLVIYGDNDPYLPSPPLRWKECTDGDYRILSVDGGHFIQSNSCTYKIISDYILAMSS